MSGFPPRKEWSKKKVKESILKPQKNQKDHKKTRNYNSIFIKDLFFNVIKLN